MGDVPCEAKLVGVFVPRGGGGIRLSSSSSSSFTTIVLSPSWIGGGPCK